MHKLAVLIFTIVGLSACQSSQLFLPPLEVTTPLQESAKYQDCSIAPALAQSAYNSNGQLKNFSDAYKDSIEKMKAFIESKEPLSGQEETKANLIKKFDSELSKGIYKNKAEHIRIYNELGRCINSKNRMTPELREKVTEIRDHIAKTHLPQEQKLFLSRTGGRKFCTNNLIKQFSMGRIQATPTTQCMYYSEGDLKAAQITNDGILADSAYGEVYPGDGHYIMIRNPNNIDTGVADGQYLRPGYFSYEGLYQYRTLLFASKTIHSFKRMNVTTDELFKDIYFYNGY